jgi:nitrilase
VFPETFIPTYPDRVWRAAAWDGPFEALTARLREQSVEVPSSATEELGKAARRAKAYLSVGVNELDGSRSTTRNCCSAPTVRSRGSTGS